MFDEITSRFHDLIVAFTQLWPERTFLSLEMIVLGLLATLLVCVICGSMGVLVVGNRMAFFSDALAHCAFAGVGFGLLLCVLLETDVAHIRERITMIMVGFGVLVGLLIAFVREKTGLARDTVIGVFYAAAVGLGAMFTKLVSERRNVFSIENFIFGHPLSAEPGAVLLLALLALGIAVVLMCTYNGLILGSASPSLALSRRVPVRFYHYLLIVLLALMVNLSVQIVGALLINGLLIVPAATAANLTRNLRQMFWYAIGLSVGAGLGGFLICWELSCANISVGVSGTIVVLCTVLFALSMIVGPYLRDARPVLQQVASGKDG